MNKENKFENLSIWCEKYYQDVGLKVHPSNVPTDVILDEMLGVIANFKAMYDHLLHLYKHNTDRINYLEKEMAFLKSGHASLHTLLTGLATIAEKAEKPKAKAVKK